MCQFQNHSMVLAMRSVLLCTLLLWTAGCALNKIEPVLKLSTAPCHGQDILGLARQDTKMISKNWKQGECLGVMAGTFGSIVPAVEKVVKPNLVPAVRWHLSFCNHGDQCQPGECKTNDLPCLRKKAQRINDFHKKYPNTSCYISPRCEYSEKNCAKVQSWFTAVKQAAPLCTLVASPMPGSCVPQGVLLEKHGNSPGNADIVSNDGSNIFDADSVKYGKLGKVINFKWTNRNNLRLTSEKGAAPPPLKRPLTNRLGEQDLKQMQRLSIPLAAMPVPAFCSKFRSLSGAETWKNHAEDYGAANDARGNKPLLITSKKGSKWEIFNDAGKVVGCMKYYGPYQKLHRFYVGSCSGDHAIDLYSKAGDWIFVKEGNTCIGLPSIRRWGTFR